MTFRRHSATCPHDRYRCGKTAKRRKTHSFPPIVQIVNTGYQVFDKTTGASVFGPASIESIWLGFGGACEIGGAGDPVMVYDQIAGRWVITQFASLTGMAPITDE